MSSLDDLFNEAAQVQEQLKANPPARPALQPPQELSLMDRLLAQVPTGLVNNPAVAATRTLATSAAAPIVGGAQLIANAFPDSTGLPQLYNRKVAEMLRADQAGHSEEGPVGSAVNEFAGSMISPANLVTAGAKPAVTAGQRALQGAGFGAYAGATAPVEASPQGEYWGQKGAQTLLATATGGVVNPVLGAIGDRVMARINTSNFDPTKAASEADDIISSALQDSKQSLSDLPPGQLDALRKQVTNALANGTKLDAAAALRLQDFKAEGINPLQGWVTRDPMQWAAEQNVRGVKGAGEKVGDAIVAGNQNVMQKVAAYSENAQEPAVASQSLATALRNYGQGQQAGVTSAYQEARNSAGKDLDVPLTGLAQDYANAVDTFGDKIPSAVQAKFRALGLDPAQPSNQQKVFTFQNADDLRKVINAHVGSDPVTNKALGAIRTALDRAQTNVDTSGGPFAPAVQAAHSWFDQQRAVPALGDAIGGPVDDRFVKQAVISNPSTPDVQKLAALLREQAPDQFEAVRQQIGQHLSEAAFGTNAAGDSAVSQAGYNKALNNLGTGKLNAFFEPAEVEQLKRLGRLSAYQVQPPAGAASNYSNTASAIANILRKTGGILPFGGGKPVQFLGDVIEAHSAVHPSVPAAPNLTDEQRQMLSRALLSIGGGASLMAPRIVGQ